MEAGVTARTGVLDSWRTIFWLRWRLTRNQWSRMGSLNEAAGILLAVCGGLAIVIASVTGFLLGAHVFALTPPETLFVVWDAAVVLFLFFWFIGVLTELQRSESLDVARLLHLPVTLEAVYLLNFAASWLTPSLFIGIPGFVALAIGLAIGRDTPALFGMIPVILVFFFVVTAITYWLRGWLVSLMANERRRRAILVAASFAAVLIIQMPNFYFNVLRQDGPARTTLPAWFEDAHRYIPLLWVAQSASALDDSRPRPAVLAILGGLALGSGALWLGYRGTDRFYRAGGKVRRLPPTARAEDRPFVPSQFLERRLPGCSEETSAVALATMRSHLRASEVKMVLFGQIVMNVALGFVFLRPSGAAILHRFQSATGTTIVLLSLFGAVQLFFNQFGFDRDGFRAYVLSPVSRRGLLLGKNIAVFPFVAAAGLLVLGVALGFGLIGPIAFVSSLLTFVAGFLIFATLGNWLSTVSPYRMASGSLKPTKVPPKVTLMIFVGMFLSPVAATILYLPVTLEGVARWLRWPAGLPVALVASVLLLAAAIGVYAALLPPLGRLLQRHEREVLLAVTREIE